MSKNGIPKISLLIASILGNLLKSYVKEFTEMNHVSRGLFQITFMLIVYFFIYKILSLIANKKK